MTPLPPGALEHLLKPLPPEREDPFPHLEHHNPDQLLQRRVEVTGQIKILEQERQTIDADLQAIFSDSELRLGVSAPGGWLLKQRSRTSWEYPPQQHPPCPGSSEHLTIKGQCLMLQFIRKATEVQPYASHFQ